MTQSYSRKPSLDNALARVGRAGEHLTRLKVEITTAWPPLPDGGVQIYGNIPPIKLVFQGGAIPPIISILVGECVYNLRAALDYLVYELALLDSGQVQEGTQFPIEDSEEGWKTHSVARFRKNGSQVPGYYLAGVSDSHKACIKLLQPRYGTKWTGTLRDISNPDKHKRLTNARASHTASPIGKATIQVPGLPVKMDVQQSFQIAFDDGLPVIETLQEIKLKITDVLAAFEPEFKR